MPSARQPDPKQKVISNNCETECLRPELVIRRNGYCIEINAGVSRFLSGYFTKNGRMRKAGGEYFDYDSDEPCASYLKFCDVLDTPDLTMQFREVLEETDYAKFYRRE